MNLDTYTTEMAKSVWDKSFFMDKIPGVKYIIDFGCADGAMLHFLAPLFPEINFIGYDIDEELIKRGRAKAPFHSNIIYFDKIEHVINYMQITPMARSEEICINFSSVLHEVFSSTGGISKITHLINVLKPEYITIRDMYSEEHYPFVGNTYLKILDKIEESPKLCHYTQEFMKEFGIPNDWSDLMHLLMKLQWVDNGWTNEMKENYFSWNINGFLKLLDNKYVPCFECLYQLPYLSEKWKKEYDFYNPDIHTHAQFILRRL